MSEYQFFGIQGRLVQLLQRCERGEDALELLDALAKLNELRTSIAMTGDLLERASAYHEELEEEAKRAKEDKCA